MKLTREILKQIVKEEVGALVLSEAAENLDPKIVLMQQLVGIVQSAEGLDSSVKGEILDALNDIEAFQIGLKEDKNKNLTEIVSTSKVAHQIWSGDPREIGKFDADTNPEGAQMLGTWIYDPQAPGHVEAADSLLDMPPHITVIPVSGGEATARALHDRPERGEDIGVNENSVPAAVFDVMYDNEGKMAKSQLYKIEKYARELHNMLEDSEQLESWVQAKLTKASDYMESVKHHLEYTKIRSGQLSDENFKE